jgi:hypothetical protein
MESVNQIIHGSQRGNMLDPRETFPLALFGDSRVSKDFPIEWLRALLRQHSPHCGDK